MSEQPKKVIDKTQEEADKAKAEEKFFARQDHIRRMCSAWSHMGSPRYK